MNDSNDKPLPTHGHIHVWFRGASRSLGDVAYDDLADKLTEVIWEMGVGETDTDPMYFFDNYALIGSYEMVHQSCGYDETEGRVTEFRVFNCFNHVGKLMDSLTLQKERKIEEGELG